MSDEHDRPGRQDGGGAAPEPGSARQPEPRDRDPWAPPAQRVPLDKPSPRPSVADQPTVTSTPGLPPLPPRGVPGPPPPAPPPGAVPPPPPAPTGPGTPSAYPGGPYGTVGHGGQPGPYAGAASYGQPAPYGVPGYGHPGGYPGPAGPYAPGGGYLPNNGHGTAALVLGIVGLVLCFSVVFGIVLGVLGIVFGALGRTKAATGEATNGGMALAGLILGVIAIVASVLMIFVYIAADEDDDDPYDPYDDTAAVLVVPSPGSAAPAAMSR
ncbi:DUF4190 domain-containing protein [Streptomyces sp. HD1123-B1]|uniref:DUF4190 domain-containing protein n=1 Tax=Streptomyces TaxID=1883 RepID=UPI0020C88CF4|nr:DUF4190 domain-containing protein [Streptomyces sp. NEAU-Y11]MCP9209413.1 DUF4190 domain-containing protein [Streptomyces sp. NEAU-Y11]